MKNDIVTTDCFIDPDLNARNVLLNTVRFAGLLKDVADCDPRFVGAVGLALGTAALQVKPWDPVLLDLVRSLSLKMTHYNMGPTGDNGHHIKELQTQIWEYVSPHWEQPFNAQQTFVLPPLKSFPSPGLKTKGQRRLGSKRKMPAVA